jgi:hypothetical protein
MTRETKVGLALASSFVLLVGVVIVARLSRPARSDSGDADFLAQSSTDQDNETRTNSAAPRAKAHETTPEKTSSVKQAKFPLNNENILPVEPSAVGKKKNDDNDALFPDFPTDNTPTPTPTPSVAANPEEVKKKKEIGDAEIQKKLKEALAEMSPKSLIPKEDKKINPMPMPVPSPQEFASNQGTTTPKEDKHQKMENLFPKPAAPVVGVPAKQGPTPASMTNEKKSVIPAPTPANESLPLPEPTPVNSGPNASAKKPEPPSPIFPSTPQTSLPGPPTPEHAAPKQAAPMAIKGPKVIESPSVALNRSNDAPPVKMTLEAERSVPSNQPRVKQYTVQTIITLPQDRSFEDLSRRLYNDPHYAQALLQFNRNMPNAPPNLQQDPPVLQPGTSIMVPPQEILEKTYKEAVRMADGRKAAISMGQPLPLSGGPGDPKVLAGPPPGTRLPPSAGLNADNTRNYTVRPGGEHILELARNFLGSGQRWPEIYRLNPNIRPEVPIPAGTVIRLPLN